MENKKTPETLTPEQMESGKWYVVTITDSNNWLIKFDNNNLEYCYHQICIFMRDGSIYNHIGALCLLNEIQSIRHATKEEVLKYFPDEVFENVSLINEVNNSQVTEQQKEKWSEKIDEIIDTHVVQKLKPEPIELRPEDLKAGEVYKATYKSYWWIFKHEETNEYNIRHSACIDYENERENNGILSINHKFYHATPEEKKLLLGEEETELEKVKKLLEESNRLYALKTIEFTKLQEKYEKLLTYNDELTERINQTEIKNNQEKVYIHYNSKQEKWLQAESLELALQESSENKNIYEAHCIGKKKSVLVSE